MKENMNEMNYPVVYALLPMKEQNGYFNDKPIFRTYYIVSKAFLVNQSITILPTLKSFTDRLDFKVQYDVVFPYKDVNKYEFIEFPSYKDNTYQNSISVNKIYETFEDAKVDAEKLNQETKEKFMPNQEDEISREFIDSIKDIWQAKESIYLTHEKIVEELTKETTLKIEDKSLIKKLSANERKWLN